MFVSQAEVSQFSVYLYYISIGFYFVLLFMLAFVICISYVGIMSFIACFNLTSIFPCLSNEKVPVLLLN